MHKNHADIINQAWDDMHNILDREMPVKKKRRKGFFFLLTGLGSVAAVLLVAFLLNQNSNTEATNQIPTIAQTSELKNNNNQVDNSPITPEKVIAITENSINQVKKNNKTNTPIEKSQNTDVIKTSSDVASGNQNKKPVPELEYKSTENLNSTNQALVENSTQINKNSTDTQPQRNAEIASTIKPTNSVEPSPVLHNQVNKNNPVTTQTSSPTTHHSEKFLSLDNQSKAVTKQFGSSVNHVSEKPLPFDNKQEPVVVNQNGVSNKVQNVSPDLKPTDKQASNKHVANGLISIQSLTTINTELKTIFEPIAMTLPFVDLIKTETVNYPILMSGLTLGLQGSYLTNNSGIGIEGYIGYSKQLSRSFAIEYRLGYGQLWLSEDLDDTSADAFTPPMPTDVSMPENNTGDTTGTQGSPETIETGMELDMGFAPEEPEFMFDREALQQLSTANLSRLNVWTNGIYAHWHFTRKIGISVLGGLDYIHKPSFRPLFILNNTQLVSDLDDNSRTQNQVEEVEFSIDNEWKFNTGVDLVFRISPTLSFSAGYKHYLSNLINQGIETNINQGRVGLRYAF